jgi:hypothetical protein
MIFFYLIFNNKKNILYNQLFYITYYIYDTYYFHLILFDLIFIITNLLLKLIFIFILIYQLFL